jgi:GNAT superfamily N-acetyltransferase
LGQRYGLEIRAAVGSDAPGLATLLADLGAEPSEPQALAARLDAIPRAGGGVLIALEWGPPSGVIVLQVVHDLAAARPAGLIASLGVAPEARRRGIGRLLVKAVARSARLAGCDRLLLRHEGAEDLAAFAAATGFTPERGLAVRSLLRRGGAAD